MGHFRVLTGPGGDIGYALSIVEKTMNLVFMLDAETKLYLVW